MPPQLTYEQALAAGGRPIAGPPPPTQPGGKLTYAQAVAAGGRDITGTAIGNPSAWEVGWRRFKDFSPIGAVRETTQLARELAGPAGQVAPGATLFKKMVIDPMMEQFRQAAVEARKGETLESFSRRVAGAVPVLGPLTKSIAEIGEQEGLAGLTGAALGLLSWGPTLRAVPPVVRGTTRITKAGIGVVKTVAPIVRHPIRSAKALELEKGLETIQQEWSVNALNLLKRARLASTQYAGSLYPKIRTTFDPKVIQGGLTNAWAGKGIEAKPAGIRAAEQKLFGKVEAGESGPLSIEGLRAARQKLWTWERNKNLPPDEFKAYQEAYHSLTNQLRKAHENAGVLAQFIEAERNWAVHMDDFHGLGSPIRGALEAERLATGEIEAAKVLPQLGKGTVSGQKLRRMEEFGVTPGLGTEARRLVRFPEPESIFSVPVQLQTPFRRIKLIREGLGYLTSRPLFYRSLREQRLGIQRPITRQPVPPPAQPPPRGLLPATGETMPIWFYALQQPGSRTTIGRRRLLPAGEVGAPAAETVLGPAAMEAISPTRVGPLPRQTAIPTGTIPPKPSFRIPRVQSMDLPAARRSIVTLNRYAEGFRDYLHGLTDEGVREVVGRMERGTPARQLAEMELLRRAGVI